MARLKGVIFGVDNVLVKEGTNDFRSDILTDVGRLVRFLRNRRIEPVVLTNRTWTIGREGSEEPPRPAQEYLEQRWGPIRWFKAGSDGVPWKQRAAALQHIREQMGWVANETLFVGNSDADMRSAINGGVLLLNALWFGKQMDYGLQFESPKKIARFVDVFCLREHFWFWRVEDGALRVYSLAPYGTMVDEYKEYSENFIVAVKRELGSYGDFWARYLCTSMYFSGLYNPVNYLTSYPKHTRGEYPEVLIEPMTAFVKCFRGNYLPDLITRHTDAPESKRNRGSINHTHQLNTIHLRRDPLKRGEERYKNPPLCGGKTVLVIDDICTQGFSFEAAGTYIRQTGAQTVFVSLLKTLNRDYEVLAPTRLARGPYLPNQFDEAVTARVYPYRGHIVDHAAPKELRNKLRQYHSWDWPVNEKGPVFS